MDDLIAFLRAQLDDDERVARAAQPGPWTMRENGGSTPWTDIDAAEGTVTSSYEGDVVAVKDAEHIVRWDPARVLAEVEAKRHILDLHTGEHDCPEMHTGTYPADWLESTPWGKAGERWAHPSVEHFEADRTCPTVRLIALPYAGRDGWREEWATR